MNKNEILKELETAITDHNVLELIAERIYDKVVSEKKADVPVERWTTIKGGFTYERDNVR